jgi:hypothetical protein
MLTKRLGARISVQSRLPSVMGTSIVLAVHDQRRCGDLASAQIRAKLVLHQEPHRHEPVMMRADIDGRSKRSFHEMPDQVFSCQRERDRGAE